MSKYCKDTLQNAKDGDKMRVWRKVRTEYLSDAIMGRATGSNWSKATWDTNSDVILNVCPGTWDHLLRGET